MKNILEISPEEKNRIRGLHETYKRTQGGLITEQEVIIGCMDDTYTEYNPEATEDTDPTSCKILKKEEKKQTVKGCMNAKYKEYNPEATEDTNPTSCKNIKKEHIIKGCLDKEASNYKENKEANTHDKALCTYKKGGIKGTGLGDGEVVTVDSSGRQDPQYYQKLQNQLKKYYDAAFLGKKIALYKGKRAGEKQGDTKFWGIKLGGMKEAVTVKNTSPKILFDKKEMVGMVIPTDKGNMTYDFDFDVNERGDNKVEFNGKTRYFSPPLGKVMDKIEDVIEKMNEIRLQKPKTDY